MVDLLPFETFTNLSENFRNFVGAASTKPERERWADRCWTLLVDTYSKIGGLVGAGFSSKQDMIDNIPFWKLYVHGERVLVCGFFKDTGGRKCVALATDGSAEAKKILAQMLEQDLGVSYGEKSGGALIFTMKTVKWSTLEPFLITPRDLAKILPEKKIIIPSEDFVWTRCSKADRAVYNKFPQLKDYWYARDIGGEIHLKVALGTPNKHIV
jgi:hypothetical protein